MTNLKPAHLLALLGVVSGVLTTFVKLEAFVIGDVSVLPGIFFGLVLAYGLYRWQTQNLLPLIGIVLLVIVAWYAAYFSCILLHDPVKNTLSLRGAQIFAVLGLIGGFIGSFITARAIHIFSPAFRERKTWWRVVVFGTAAGILLAVPEMGFSLDFSALIPWLTERQAELLLTLRETGFNLDNASLLPLFVVWQAGVAYLVAGGITGLK